MNNQHVFEWLVSTSPKTKVGVHITNSTMNYQPIASPKRRRYQAPNLVISN